MSNQRGKGHSLQSSPLPLPLPPPAPLSSRLPAYRERRSPCAFFRAADIKALQARWHPDRFVQKFGARLGDGSTREIILNKVTETAAAINVLRDTIEGRQPPAV